jgi:hypothetical protein
LQLARLADCPELAMDEQEAREFLAAWQNYLRHLSVEATQQTVDLITAVGVTVFVYTPRLVALNRRRRPGQRQQQPPRPPAQVFTFRPAQTPPPPWQPAETMPPAGAPAAEAPVYEADLSGNAFGPAGNDPEAAE